MTGASQAGGCSSLATCFAVCGVIAMPMCYAPGPVPAGLALLRLGLALNVVALHLQRHRSHLAHLQLAHLAHIALLCDKNGFSFFLCAEVTSERLAEAVSLAATRTVSVWIVSVWTAEDSVGGAQV